MIPAALVAVAAIGHTSGWDALAGALIVLRAIVTRFAYEASRAYHVPPNQDPPEETPWATASSSFSSTCRSAPRSKP